MIDGLRCVDLRLPAVYGERFSGRLSALNAVPVFLRNPALALATAFRPAVHADRVAAAIIGMLEKAVDREVIVADAPEDNPVYRAGKRLMDFCFVAGVVVLLWWLLVLVWITVKLTSPGPGVFAQPRVGKGERIFTCYKVRTMRTGAPQAGTHEVPAAHITPVGRFLRRTKIDELPQIWNVARGEMSLIGPRPCLPSQTDLIAWRRKLGVFACRPGISGLAQVEGVDMSEPERLARLDARYCASRGLVTDIRLAVATLLG
jgi:lipopolysaccharide/colanic/teichoic acid biosynthesis glycosyltransferase